MKTREITSKEISFDTNFEMDKLQSTDDLEKLYSFNESQIEMYDKGIQIAIGKGDSFNAIQEVQNQLRTFQLKIKAKLDRDKPKKPEISYDTQSILSSSSVTKKDSRLLVKIPDDYFTTRENFTKNKK